MRIKTLKLSEKQFMAQVLQFARMRSWRVYHTHDSRRSVAGFPDLLMIRGTVLIVAELKVGRRETTPEQDEWLHSFTMAGITAFVWRETDWDEIVRILM